MNRICYNPKLKELARKLRKNSTRAEIKLWHYLKGRQLMGYDFHRQKPIENYIADFFCGRLKLVIELDGYTHAFESVVKRDEIKDERLNELGISVLRFSDEDVMNNIEGVLLRIEDFIGEYERKHTPDPS
jgi:very-short-patch-repair endonuclease